MTTIAYHHGDKQIAIDSRTTSGGRINTDKAEKIIKRGRRKYYMCGSTCDYDRFVNEAENGEGTIELEAWCFMVEGGKVYKVTQERKRYLFSLMTFNESMGSGSDYALAAMDFGQSAKQAVQYAAKRDIYTGGKIRVFNVK